MNDLEMAKQLTDMGYDVEIDLDTGTYNEGLVAEMAVNEGYKYNEDTNTWE